MRCDALATNELFLKVKRALNPTAKDVLPYRRYEQSLSYTSARSQIASVSIEEEGDELSHNINGLLYSWLSLKELPDTTFAGMLRELMIQDFPVAVSAEFMIPDQTKVVRAEQEPAAQDAGCPA